MADETDTATVDPASYFRTHGTIDPATLRAAWAALCHNAAVEDLPVLAAALGITRDALRRQGGNQ